MIRILTIVILSLTLTACGSRQRINYGAAKQVHVGSAQYMFDMQSVVRRESSKITQALSGFTELPSGDITIGEQVHEWRLVEVWTHELVRHALPQYLADHPGPFNPDDFLHQYEGQFLNFNLYDEGR